MRALNVHQYRPGLILDAMQAMQAVYVVCSMWVDFVGSLLYHKSSFTDFPDFHL